MVLSPPAGDEALELTVDVIADGFDAPEGWRRTLSVHLDDLDGRVPDVQAGAEDAILGDGDVVGELGAEDDELVEPGAAVHRHRGVDVVPDLVLAAEG